MADFLSVLKDACPQDWRRYTRHPFVESLGDGSLVLEAFRFYLAQDYVFLKHFGRAYALAAYKSESLADMRGAAATLDALINHEMAFHLTLAKRWGISAADLEATVEHPANMAYTRFVLERGMAGDLLDLLVALAPCVVGYGEIGARLLEERKTALSGNPYREWIETYGGFEYQELVTAARGQLERVAQERLGSDPRANGRWDSLAGTFRAATRLEIGFWQMGLEASLD